MLKIKKKTSFVLVTLGLLITFLGLNYSLFDPVRNWSLVEEVENTNVKKSDNNKESESESSSWVYDVSIKELVERLKRELSRGSEFNSSLNEDLRQKISQITEQMLSSTNKVEKPPTQESIERNMIINEMVTNENRLIQINENIKQVDATSFLNGDESTKEFFSQILQLMSNNRLAHPLKQRMKMKNGRAIISPVHLISDYKANLSEVALRRLFNFPPEFIEDATVKHKNVTDNLPNFTPNFYEGKGYVVVGGGKYTWLALLSIEILRSVGSVLPVEVFIPTEEEFEEEFCNTILPKYNARCIQVGNVFDKDLLKELEVSGYQYKSLALLTSSFEHAFLLDSDDYPVTNPDVLFDSALYENYTMITWPDYWRRTTSPLYYDVTGKKVGNQTRYLNDEHTDSKYFRKNADDKTISYKVQFHDREGTIRDWTTESGQMLINKKVHFKALLLALYYNLEGKFGFYPLLSQGGAGEGDKETFVAAANFYGLDYYQVHKNPDRAYGYFRPGTGVMDTTIVQYDPIRDSELVRYVGRGVDAEIELNKGKFRYDYQTLHQKKITVESSNPMFYHVHDPKMDPFAIYLHKSSFNLKDEKIRNLGGDYPRFGFDLELLLWEKINQHLCLDKTNIAYFNGSSDFLIDSICTIFMPDQLQFLKQSQELLLNKYNHHSPYDNLRRYQFDVPKPVPDTKQVTKSAS